MNLLFVHPEGNLANSPHLSTITRLLAASGHRVTVRGPAGRFFRTDDPAVRLVEISPLIQRALNRLARTPARWRAGRMLARFGVGADAPYDVIVGVDRQGLLEATAIAETQGAAVAYWSNEIFFASECPSAFKALEREAARHVSFAVAPDDIRAGLLAQETGIPADCILRIPVAGMGVRPGPRSSYLHERLQIPRTHKIAIVTGSLAAWTAIPQLLETISAWPPDWVLVLHDRYGQIPDAVRSAREQWPDRVYVTPGNLPRIEELDALLRSADVGLAFYRATYDSLWTGANIAYIGMSSGKIATYLQHGLPVMTNEIGEMASHIRRENLGLVVGQMTEIPDRLAAWDPAPLRQNCLGFFQQHLDVSLHIDALARALESARGARPPA